MRNGCPRREAIRVVPPVCDGCAAWEACRAGCRGWAYYLTGGWTEAGPDCGKEILEQGSAR